MKYFIENYRIIRKPAPEEKSIVFSKILYSFVGNKFIVSSEAFYSFSNTVLQFALQKYQFYFLKTLKLNDIPPIQVELE
jgi:hypothetical protein